MLIFLRSSLLKSFSTKIISSFIIFIFFTGINLQAQDDGKKLFQICSACHSIGKGKLIGPDLKGVTERLDRDWLASFINNSQAVVQSGDEYAVKVFQEYNSIPMPPNNYSDEQMNILLDYIENFDKAPKPVETVAVAEAPEVEGEYVFMEETAYPFANLRISFIISAIIIALSLIDLFITKIVKTRFIHILIILISGAIITEIIVTEAISSGRATYYEPDQPIQFSHKIHSGDNQIDCEYCHFTVDESKYAGIPPVQLCMNCHNLIKEGPYTGKEEIAKIYTSLETGMPIEWVKVYYLPDHVYFSHAQHVAVGKLECEECHGDLTSVDRVQQIGDLSMGWCIECHRIKEVQFIDNDFYSRYTKLHEELRSGDINRVTVSNIGGDDCQKCHY